MPHRFLLNIFLALKTDPQYRFSYGENRIKDIQLLMKQMGFSYTELLDMDVKLFNNFVKNVKKQLTEHNDRVKKVFKSNGSLIRYTIDINDI